MFIQKIYKRSKDFFFSSTSRTKITVNVLWQVGDKFIRMGMGLIVLFWIGRFLGTEQFGAFNIALAYITLFGAFANLGLDDIAAKAIVNDPMRTSMILGSTFVLKFIGGVFVCLVASISILLVSPDKPVEQILVIILSVSVVFQALNTIDFYYVAKVQSRYSIIAKNIPFLLVSVIKIVLLLTARLTVVQLAVLTSFETLMAGLLLVFFYQKSHASVRKWKVSLPYCKELLKQSWPLIFSALVITIYTRIDQIMIGKMLGESEVGIYSAALRISEIWFFLPVIMAASIYPNLIETRKQDIQLYQKRHLTLFRLMNAITFSGALLITFCSEFIIKISWGESFIDAAPILSIHIWTGVFFFLGMGGSRFYIIENLQYLHFRRTLCGAILNIVLNFILIPRYGGVGAAIGILITQFFVSYFVELFSPKTRILFLLKSKSFLLFKN